MARRNEFSIGLKNYIYLYTKGGQFSLDGKEYIGEYHFDGTIAKAGPVPPPPSQPEAPTLRRLYNNPDHYTYDSVKKFSVPVLLRTDPQPYLYAPVESAYIVGFDARYFVEKINDDASYAIEINREEAIRYGKTGGIDAGLYPIVEILWKLTGRRDDIINHNELQLYKATNLIPSIGYTVKNFLEFARITATESPTSMQALATYPDVVKNKYRKLFQRGV